MSKKNIYVLFIAGIIVSLFINLAIVYFFTVKADKKIAYVKLVEVYDGFELKKQLSAKMSQAETARKNILDSLEFRLRSLEIQLKNTKSDKASQQVFEAEKENYLYKKQQFAEDDEEMASKYNEQIWSQINQYVTEYGKEKQFEYILGAEGNGSIMYGNEADDITKEIIAYINNKYHGK